MLQDEDEDEDDYCETEETESVVVVQDASGKKRPKCTTHFDEIFDGEPV